MKIKLQGVTVAVGSSNPAKIKAVESALKKLKIKASVRSCLVKTTVGPQPLSLKETLRGALERAHNARALLSTDLGVGLESGIVSFPATISGYLNFQICAIIDRDGRVTLGTSPGFEFPTQAVRKVISGEVAEFEVLMEKISGEKRIGEKYGAIGFLTRNVVTRQDLGEHAVIMALIPRLNPELYSEPPSLEEVLKEI